MEKEYKIAGHRIRIAGEALVNAVAQIDGFAPFEVTVEGTPVSTFSKTEQEAPVMTEVLYTTHLETGGNIFGHYDGGYLFTMTSSEGKQLQLWQATGSDQISFQGCLTEWAQVRFALWIAYGLATNRYDTVAIHTSTIQYRGKAVLFLGESGTGKSTHTRLWRQNIMGAVLLNDDSPILRIVDGEPWIFGSPWSGKTPCYKNEQYPLAGCVRLSQAPYNKIEKLSTLKAYSSLHPSCPPDFAYDDALYDCISETIGKVLNCVPVYHLACLPNAEAARLSCETIFGKV
ncbi:MAG: hypothetical protein RR365_14135 [Bacteroides sp.]